MQPFAVPPADDQGVQPEAYGERYTLRTRRDVLPVFASLAKRPIPINTRLAQLDASFTTRLIALNPSFEELVFDATGLAGVERLDGSAGLSAETHIDTVWFKFEAEHVEAVRGYTQPAFRARLPTMIARIQRRDSIRYPVPGLNPPVCDVQSGQSSYRLRAIDISLSGIALLVEDVKAMFDSGSTLLNCRLHLPDIGAITTAIKIVNLLPYATGDQRRMGCTFSGIVAMSLAHLQRYVLRLERSQAEARLAS